MRPAALTLRLYLISTLTTTRCVPVDFANHPNPLPPLFRPLKPDTNAPQGMLWYVNSSTLPSTKVKRNQFPYIVPGLVNHDFFYVIYGDFNIDRNDSSYTICTRSDDGSVSMTQAVEG